jgi:hypothetical protein
MASPLLDPRFIAEIRFVEERTGQSNVVSGLVSALEAQIARFPAGFAACVARGDGKAAVRAAHTMQGSSRQLGARRARRSVRSDRIEREGRRLRRGAAPLRRGRDAYCGSRSKR